MNQTSLLLGDPSPSLRWRTAVELEGAPDDDEEVMAWRTEIDGSEDVRELLEQLAAARQSMAVGYLLCRLAYLGYRGPELETAVESLFALQKKDGSWPAPTDDLRSGDKGTRATRSRAPATDGPRFVTMHTVVPLRGIAAAGFAADPRAERGYDWLISERLPDGSWPSGPKADLGGPNRPTQPEREYRRLPRGAGCRSATAGAVACLALHPQRSRTDVARIGVDHLLSRETRDEAAIGWELSRLVGLERALGQITFYIPFDLAFLLDLASRCGVSAADRRVRELVDYLETLRGPYGLWQHHGHPQLSRWLTFDLLASLDRLAAGDWVANEQMDAVVPGGPVGQQ
jgi:hypothetical protein